MLYALISAQTVIQKVHRDLKPSATDWHLDAIEWIGEALDYLGYREGFANLTHQTAYTDHRVSMPANLYTLESVAVDGINLVPRSRENPRSRVDYYVLEPYSRMLYLSVEAGTVSICYQGYAVDTQGFPLVPDTIYYREALFWYILAKLIMGGFRHPEFTWTFCDQRWKQYCNSAQNDIAFSSPERAAEIGAGWLNPL